MRGGWGGEGVQERSAWDSVVHNEGNGNDIVAPTQDGVFLACWRPTNVFSGGTISTSSLIVLPRQQNIYGKIINAIETTMGAVLGLP